MLWNTKSRGLVDTNPELEKIPGSDEVNKNAYIEGVSVEDVSSGSIQQINHQLHRDKAAELAYDHEVPLPPGMERRLQLKADLFITLFMALVYGIQFGDKTMTSAATTMNLRQDLHMMTGSAYSWTGSAFYLGYLVFVFPMSYLLMKTPLAKTTGILIILWGATVACAAACQSMESFMALRVLLGALESCVMPAYVVLTSQYYKREQQYSRSLCWMSMNGFGTLLTNVISVGLLNREESHGLAIRGWRILYIIMGLMTLVLGVAFTFHMPNSPSEAWFFNDEERKWQIELIRSNKQGYGSDQIKWYQVKEVFLDHHTWLYCFTVMVNNIPNGAISTMLNLLLQGMGYNEKQSLLMALPCGGAEIVGLMSTAFLSSYLLPRHRMIWSIFTAAVSLLCLCLVAWGPTSGSQLAGVYIWYWASPSSYTGLVSCIESNSAGHTKKITTNALFYVFFCVGNLVGPQTFKTSQAPEYPEGKEAMAAASACQFVLQCLILVSYVLVNRYRDRQNKRLPPDIINPEFADLTDKENPEFRYAY